MARRQLVLMVKREEGEHGSPPMGSLEEVIAILKRFNCWPDGSGPEGMGKSPGMALAYGPGMVMEIPAAAGAGEVMQVLATMTDEEYAFPVLMKLCRESGWTMMDPESGRIFG